MFSNALRPFVILLSSYSGTSSIWKVGKKLFDGPLGLAFRVTRLSRQRHLFLMAACDFRCFHPPSWALSAPSISQSIAAVRQIGLEAPHYCPILLQALVRQDKGHRATLNTLYGEYFESFHQVVMWCEILWGNDLLWVSYCQKCCYFLLKQELRRSGDAVSSCGLPWRLKALLRWYKCSNTLVLAGKHA